MIDLGTRKALAEICGEDPFVLLPLELETGFDIQSFDQALALFRCSDDVGIVCLAQIGFTQDLVAEQGLGQALDSVLRTSHGQLRCTTAPNRVRRTMSTVNGSFRLFSSVFKASSGDTSSSFTSSSGATSFLPFLPPSFLAFRRSRFFARIFSVVSSFGPGRSKYRR